MTEESARPYSRINISLFPRVVAAVAGHRGVSVVLCGYKTRVYGSGCWADRISLTEQYLENKAHNLLGEMWIARLDGRASKSA